MSEEKFTAYERGVADGKEAVEQRDGNPDLRFYHDDLAFRGTMTTEEELDYRGGYMAGVKQELEQRKKKGKGA